MKKLLLLLALSQINLNVIAQGYQFLGSYSSNGTPDYLEPVGDIIETSTLELIDGALPESYPVPNYNPHYISSGYDTDIILTDSAEVWVTFVSEGAGYRNVLGFYTYDISNPPATAPSASDITIIFPNVSALGSGGGLLTGDKVKIGNFPAQTGIGWVLLANGWNSWSQSVTSGYWQLYSNPDYNPEADSTLRHHNVLLCDTANELIILGFEDIRRDYSSCDNDFNDAIFYVTANPFTAISLNNIADVSSATDVTSANNGGLESNGSLAKRIAQRNFKREKNNLNLDLKSTQTPYKNSAMFKTSSLSQYLPTTGLRGVENAYVSSPEDLLDITNAEEVFSVDIYDNDLRVSAALATRTEGHIYDHTKVICDRLNSSKLEDVRTVDFRGHKLISSKIKRSTGEIENTLSFSIKLENEQSILYSYWDINDYPEGDYLNFQVWGSSFAQVFSIANHIIDQLEMDKPLINNQNHQPSLPLVFVKSGFYKNGELHLNVINKTGLRHMDFKGNITATESSEPVLLEQSINLSGSWSEHLVIKTGSLFDVGFTLSTADNDQKDALYMADGPWGVDYLEDYVDLDYFDVQPVELENNTQIFEVERQVELAGQVKGNINLFRHLKSGNQTLDVSSYNSIKFDIRNSMPVEVILMPEHAPEWEKRIRFTIPENTELTTYEIPFEAFKDADGQPLQIQDLKTIVFSIIGDYTYYNPFSMHVSTVQFKYTEEEEFENDLPIFESIANYPNPFSSTTMITIPRESKNISILVSDVSGRIVDHQLLTHINNQSTFKYEAPQLADGVYHYSVTDGKTNQWKGSFIIR